MLRVLIRRSQVCADVAISLSFGALAVEQSEASDTRGMHRPRSGLPCRFRRFQDTLPFLKKGEQFWPRDQRRSIIRFRVLL